MRLLSTHPSGRSCVVVLALIATVSCATKPTPARRTRPPSADARKAAPRRAAPKRAAPKPDAPVTPQVVTLVGNAPAVADGRRPKPVDLRALEWATSDAPVTVTKTADGVAIAVAPDAPVSGKATARLPGAYRSITVKLMCRRPDGIEFPNFALILGRAGSSTYVTAGQQMGVQEGNISECDTVHKRREVVKRGGVPWVGGDWFPVEMSVDLDAGTVSYKVKDWEIDGKLEWFDVPAVDTIGLSSFRQGSMFKGLTVEGRAPDPGDRDRAPKAVDRAATPRPVSKDVGGTAPARTTSDDAWLEQVYDETKKLEPKHVYMASGSGADSWTRRFEVAPADMCRVVPVEGMAFTHALEVSVPKGGPDYWSQHFKMRNTAPVKSGELVYLTLWVRNLVGGVTGRAKINQNSSNGKEWGPEFGIPDRWTRIHMVWRAPESMAARKHEFLVSFGFDGNRGVQLGGLVGIVYPAGTDPLGLPHAQVVTKYPGQEPGAAWREKALARIEKTRKGGLLVKVVDRAGRPVPRARVTATLKRHAFLFGTEAPALMFPGVAVRPYGVHGEMNKNVRPEDKRVYLSKLEEYFTAVVTGVGSYSWDPICEVQPEEGVKANKWVHEHGMKNLCGDIIYRDEYWPKQFRNPLSRKDRDGVAKATEDYIASWVDLCGSYVHAIAFVNEWAINSARHLFATPEDPDGYDLALRWFRRAEKLAPDIQLGLNDPGPSQEYAKRIRWLKKHGAKLDWVGFQWHLSIPGIPPEEMLRRFDEYAALGVDIQITEADFAIPDVGDPAQAKWQRDYLRDFYIACLSHPAVTAVSKWGFWESIIWMKGQNTAFFNEDWSLTNLGQAYHDLVLDEWKTNVDVATDARGAAHIRGFLGEYEITVRSGAKTAKSSATLVRDGTSVVVKLAD